MKNTLLIAIVFSFILAACTSAQPSTPPPAIDTGVQPGAWVIIPAGEFLMGQHDTEIMLDYDYQIMVTDVTNAEFAEYLNQALADGTLKINAGSDGSQQVVGYYPGDVFHAVKHEEEIAAGDWLHLTINEPALRLTYDGQSFMVKPGYENHPMVMVSWFGARGYCEYYGWGLPTEVEWEKAGRGSDGRPFPWGDTLDDTNANYYSSHDVLEKIVGGLGDTTPVGFYNGKTYDGFTTVDSRSPYGLYDMAGNVWQWLADIHEGTHYRHMAGGSKADYGYNLRIWTRNSAGPTYTSPNVGFRCVDR